MRRGFLLFLAAALLIPCSSNAASHAEIFGGHLRALKRAKAGWSLWHLYEAERLAPRTSKGPARLREALSTLLKSRRLPPFLKGEASLVLGDLLAREGKREEVGALALEAGIPNLHAVLGPLKGSGAALDAPSPFRRNDTREGVYGQTSWRFLETSTIDGGLGTGDILNCTGDCHGLFLFEWLTRDTKGSTVVLSSNGPVSAWLDGKPLMSWDGKRRMSRWQHAERVELAKGHHRLLIRAGHRVKTPRFSLRVVDTAGGTLSTSQFVRPDPSRQLAGFKRLEDEKVDPMASYVALPDLWARLALFAFRDDAVLAKAADVFAKLRQGRPTDVELSATLARALEHDANRARQAWETAAELSGSTYAPAVAALMAYEREQGRGLGADARCRELVEIDPSDVEALACDVELITAALGPAIGLRRLESHLAGKPPSVATKLLKHDLLERSEQHLRAARLGMELALQLGGNVGLGRRAAFAMGRAGAHDQAVEGVIKLRQQRPYSVDFAALEGSVRAVKGRDGVRPVGLAQLRGAIEVITKALVVQPSAPSLYELRGRLWLEAGQNSRGLDDIDRALSLRPQDRDLATWRRSLVDEKSLGEAYAEDVQALRKRYATADIGERGARILLDKRVVRFYGNGLASRWRQRVIRIDSASATDRFETIRFPYTPRVDRLQVLEAEITRKDGSRIRPASIRDERPSGKQEGVYTLTAYSVIRFPKLQAGDVLHLQIRRDDLGDRNLFGPFYGGFYPTQEQWPSYRTEVIVEVDADVALTTYSQGAGTWTSSVEVIVAKEAKRKRYTWTAKDVPALNFEPKMPGYGEVGSYVSVSTFKSWTELATWYRGFIGEQLLLSGDLKSMAKKLTVGRTELRGKVAAIHGWVVGTTRYVGIEFGIHGFKPYAVDDVVRRGYGDCKDKASLFIAMLHAVGVEAEFVLIRTRDRGRLGGKPPTLWAFNHAIAYVPSLDTYVDATSELAALGEVPALDQGGTLLRFPIFGEEALRPTFTELPYTPPEANVVSSEGRFQLSANGDAVATLRESITGTGVASLRRVFQNEAERERTLNRLIAQQYPGAALTSFGVKGADALGDALALELEVKIPRFGRVDGSRLTLPIHADPTSVLKRYASLDTRQHPLELNHLSEERSRTEFVPPPGASLEELPAAASLNHAVASYSLEFKRTPDGLRFEEVLRYHRASVKPDEYPAFRKFLQKVAAYRAMRITFSLASDAGSGGSG